MAILKSFCIEYALLPDTAGAASYPVSIIETGITEGFASPTLYLEPEQLTPILEQNRTLQKPYLINFNRRQGKTFCADHPRLHDCTDFQTGCGVQPVQQTRLTTSHSRRPATPGG